MYYPYLRSKQNEMLALRAIADSKTDYSNVFPIIEPIKEFSPTMKKTMEALTTAAIPYAVVVNSFQSSLEVAHEELPQGAYLPAFLCDGNLGEILSSIDKSGNEEVMLIFKNSINTEDSNLDFLIEHKAVKYIVGELGRSLKKRIKLLGKKVIHLEDAFRAMPSNALYADRMDEKYSEEHAFFSEEGYDGFADFCVLPKDMPDGGMTPTTLAIHLTYKRNEDEIWVKHFLSDNRFGRENIQGKFGEAAKHVKEFYNQHPEYLRTQAVQMLIQNFDEAHYPGLGTLKKYSIWNHLELVNSLLK